MFTTSSKSWVSIAERKPSHVSLSSASDPRQAPGHQHSRQQRLGRLRGARHGRQRDHLSRHAIVWAFFGFALSPCSELRRPPKSIILGRSGKNRLEGSNDARVKLALNSLRESESRNPTRHR